MNVKRNLHVTAIRRLNGPQSSVLEAGIILLLSSIIWLSYAGSENVTLYTPWYLYVPPDLTITN
jgi:hypothetical protein